MAMIPIQSKYPDRAGYLGLDTDRNIVKVFSDGIFISVNLDNVNNVKDFGAKGNGISDDTNAIQKALDNRNIVYIPTGTYLTTQPLIVKSNTIIIGEGFNNSIIKNTTSDVFQIVDDPGVPPTNPTLTKYSDNIVFESIQIQGDISQASIKNVNETGTYNPSPSPYVGINAGTSAYWERGLISNVNIQGFDIAIKGSLRDTKVLVFHSTLWYNNTGYFLNAGSHSTFIESEARWCLNGIVSNGNIEDMQITHSKFNYVHFAINIPTIRNMFLSNVQLFGIIEKGITSNTINGLFISNGLFVPRQILIVPNIYAIEAPTIKNSVISNCHYYYRPYSPISYFTTAIKADNIENTTISNNRFQTNKGIHITNSVKGLNISNNHFITKTAIDINSSTNKVKALNINSNNIDSTNCEDTAIIKVISQSTANNNFSIINNFINSNDNNTIYAIETYGDFNIISGNVSYATTGLHDLSSSSINGIIKDNMFN